MECFGVSGRWWRAVWGAEGIVSFLGSGLGRSAEYLHDGLKVFCQARLSILLFGYTRDRYTRQMLMYSFSAKHL